MGGIHIVKSKKQQTDYAAELKNSFDRWEHLNIHGGSDPLNSDGLNMNLVRTHIKIGKRNIEENMTPEQYPEIYYRETPPEKDRDYMARVDEIFTNSKKSLEIYKADPEYKFICSRYGRLSPKQKKETYIDAVIGYVSGLENAIKKGDLITMRRHEAASRYSDSFSTCAERVRNLKPPENEQLSLFDYYDDCDDYEEDYEDEDEWDCEI
jgi:hypothetical protein